MVDPDRSVISRDDSAAARAESIERLSCWAVRRGSASQAASASAATARSGRGSVHGVGTRPTSEESGGGSRRRRRDRMADATTYAAVTASASSAQPRARRAHQSPTRMVAELRSYAVTRSSRSLSPGGARRGVPPAEARGGGPGGSPLGGGGGPGGRARGRGGRRGRRRPPRRGGPRGPGAITRHAPSRARSGRGRGETKRTLSARSAAAAVLARRLLPVAARLGARPRRRTEEHGEQHRDRDLQAVGRHPLAYARHVDGRNSTTPNSPSRNSELPDTDHWYSSGSRSVGWSV